MQVKDKEAETEAGDLEVWGWLGGGALINIGQGLLERKEAGGGTQAGITRPANIWVIHEGGRKVSQLWK